MRPLGSPEALEKRRFRAIRFLEDGYQPVDIAKRLGVGRRSVRRWKSTYLKQGRKAVEAKPAPGRPSRINLRDRNRLRKILLRGAASSGFPTDLWTCPRVVHVIRDRFSVQYHEDHVCRILHALGFSLQRPERRAIERDEEAIRTWIQQEWPRVKKKPED